MPSEMLPKIQRGPAQACEADPSAKALAGMSVLIIEDEPLIAMSLESELQDAGAEVVKIASSSSSARSVIGEGNSFDAAIVDLHVANGDTSALARLLSERRVPVVVMTGGVIDRELLTQTVAVLRKPYPQADLIKVLARIG